MGSGSYDNGMVVSENGDGDGDPILINNVLNPYAVVAAVVVMTTAGVVLAAWQW